jgi:hypothetical protein
MGFDCSLPLMNCPQYKQSKRALADNMQKSLMGAFFLNEVVTRFDAIIRH